VSRPDLVVRGGRCLLPGGFADVDLVIAEGRIERVAPSAPDAAERYARVVDAAGLIVLPGFIDAHVHTRDPGQRHKEDYKHATRAAAAAGVTAIITQPNTEPPVTDGRGWVAALEAAKASRIDYAVFGGIAATEPDARSVAELARAGAAGFELLGDTASLDEAGWRRLFEAAAPAGLPVSLLAADRASMNRNTAAARAAGGDPWCAMGRIVDAQAEIAGYRRVVELSRRCGVPLIVRQVTTQEGLEFLRSVKREAAGVPLWVEVNVHHLFLSGQDRERLGPFGHMLPPLRDERDIEALWDGVRDGTVDFISSDHAPHTREEKERGRRDPWAAPPGIPGVDTMVPLLLDAALTGRVSVERMSDLASRAPARMHRLAGKGEIVEGKDADLVLVDPDARWSVTPPSILTRCGWSAFEGWSGRGVPRMTMLRGVAVARDGIPLDEPVGEMLRPKS
jgi:dihydroorotase